MPPHDVSSSSKGYQAEVDPETGLIYARFPPHFPEQPDRGFLFGLKSLAGALEGMWNEERLRRIKTAKDVYQLPPLSVEGREIFDEIFGIDEEAVGAAVDIDRGVFLFLLSRCFCAIWWYTRIIPANCLLSRSSSSIVFSIPTHCTPTHLHFFSGSFAFSVAQPVRIICTTAPYIHFFFLSVSSLEASGLVKDNSKIAI